MPERSDIRGWRADGTAMITEVHFTMIPGGLQGVGSDVTEIRRLQAELAEQALHDALTGLANRHLVDELMAVGLARAERQGTLLAVAFVDLDDFKSVNDTYGHDAGDEVLHEAAGRMLSVARSADIVARIGGDEFLIVFEPNESGQDNLVARLERRARGSDRDQCVGRGDVSGEHRLRGHPNGAGATRPRCSPRPTPTCTRSRGRIARAGATPRPSNAEAAVAGACSAGGRFGLAHRDDLCDRVVRPAAGHRDRCRGAGSTVSRISPRCT